MKQRKVIPKSKGVTLGAGVCGFFSFLFESNELLPIKRRMSDALIRKQVLAEFPGRKGQFFSEKPGVTVNEYRNRYNKGTFTRGIPPERMSFRYEKHLPVDARTGKYPLIAEEIAMMKKNHEKMRSKIIAKLTGKKQ